MVPRALPIRSLAFRVVSIAAALALASGLVAILESAVNVPNASAAYILAVIVLAVGLGIVEAVVAALGSFLAYDYLFIEPVHTFAVVDPGEWLNLLLLLVVGLVVGQLAGRQRRRADVAELREREARGLFQVSRVLATARDTREALDAIVLILRDESRMARVWIGLAGTTPLERVIADTGAGATPPAPTRHELLRRTAGDAPAEWVALHKSEGSRRTVVDPDLAAHRVVIEADGRTLGSVWCLRARSLGPPAREETRLLAAAADQIGQAVERDRLRAEATSLEVARRSDELKSALLDSVSHDLRTPLATIRAAAGSLAGDAGPAGDGVGARGSEVADAATIIDRQAQYLDRLVTNLLDLSRIEAGALRPELRPILLDDAVADTLERLATAGAGRISTDIALTLPPVLVDEVYLDAILTNLLENALAYSPPDAQIVVRAVQREPECVRLTVEDSGSGVAPEAVEHLFEKFYRATTNGRDTRRGSGIGLSVVKGLGEASGGRVAARRSDLGGLAIDVDLPAAPSSFADTRPEAART